MITDVMMMMISSRSIGMMISRCTTENARRETRVDAGARVGDARVVFGGERREMTDERRARCR